MPVDPGAAEQDIFANAIMSAGHHLRLHADVIANQGRAGGFARSVNDEPGEVLRLRRVIVSSRS